MTVPEAMLLAGAAELVVSAGALEEAMPLAEVPVDGAVDVSVGVGDVVSVGGADVVGGAVVGSVGLVVVGFVDGGLVVGDLDGVGDFVPLVPLGLSEGVPLLDGGVGSSDVP